MACSTCCSFVLVLLIARIQPILNIPRDTVEHGEAQAPDCSSITDARNNESLNILVKELDTNLDLKFRMPDDQARQVRDVFLLVLFWFKILLFHCLKNVIQIMKDFGISRLLVLLKNVGKFFLIVMKKELTCLTSFRCWPKAHKTGNLIYSLKSHVSFKS